MLDITQLRKELDTVIERLNARKNPQPFLDVERFKALEAERKGVQPRTEELQARRNALSKQIGMAKGKGEDASALMAEVGSIADELKAGAERLDAIQHELNDMLMVLRDLLGLRASPEFEAWLQKMGVFEAGEGSRLMRALPEAFAPVLARLESA